MRIFGEPREGMFENQMGICCKGSGGGSGVNWIPLFVLKIHTDNVNADLCMMSPPIDYLCLFWEICPPPPWALDLIRSHLKVTQASPRFVSKKHFADLGPHSLKLVVMKSCLTTVIIISGDVLSEEEVMMLINAADKVIVNKFIYWPKFSSLILVSTPNHFLEASLLIVI